MKILWVDDQVDAARTFAHTLAPLGAQIDFSPDGEHAFDKLQEAEYDLVVADLAMPPGRWGGLWLLEQIKKIESPPRVIVVSGEGSQQETIQAIRLGAADYITKERLVDELLSRIQILIENRSERAQEIREIISRGESSTLEFKSSLRMNLHTGRTDPNIELSALKSIAAFLNSSGGTLLIGVNDQGVVVGIELDKFQNIDKFQLHFWNLFREALGAEFSGLLKTEVVSIGERSVFSISCTNSDRPAFLRWKNAGESRHQEIFFVRAGPQTEQLGTRQAVSYISTHFKDQVPLLDPISHHG